MPKGIYIRKIGSQKGEKNGNWKGNNVGYWGIHAWIRRNLGRANKCILCNTIGLKRYEWANVSHNYRRDKSDWIELCCSCHGHYDKNYERGWKTRRKNGNDKFYGNQFTGSIKSLRQSISEQVKAYGRTD